MQPSQPPRCSVRSYHSTGTGALLSPPLSRLFPYGDLVPALVLVEVLLGNVVLGNLPRADSTLVGIGRVLDPADDAGLEGLALFEKFLDALRIRQLGSRESFGVA